MSNNTNAHRAFSRTAALLLILCGVFFVEAKYSKSSAVQTKSVQMTKLVAKCAAGLSEDQDYNLKIKYRCNNTDCTMWAVESYIRGCVIKELED